MIDHGRFNILGIGIDAVDYEAAVERVMGAARQRQPFAVSALAVHGLMTGALDPVHRYRLNRFDMLVPDGQPVRWALGWLHQTYLADRVYGPNLMLKLCERASADGIGIFLFGGTEELLARLSANLVQRFPRLIISGQRSSRFRQLTPAERDETVAEIRSSGAGLTFVGLGCPRQEVWAYEFRDAIAVPLIAVGAAFNFHAGVLSQAPAALQRSGLEWLYRLTREPRRLWRRYLLLNPLYLLMLAAQRTGLRRYDPKNAQAPSAELLYG